jgi:hypothetical protein
MPCGSDFLGRNLGPLTWTQLTALSPQAGTQAFCTDYPGPTAGAKVYWTGSRWRPIGSRTILKYLNWPGLTVASNTAKFLLGGVTTLIKRGMLIIGDEIVLISKYDKAASTSGSANLEICENTTTDVVNGSVVFGYYNAVTSAYKYTTRLSGDIISNTVVLGQGASAANVGPSQTSLDFSRYTIHDLSGNDLYVGLTFVENTGGSCIIYKAQMDVNFI